MLFNSLSFLIFFPAVVFLYFLIPYSWRSPFLLLASCVFYMAYIPAYLFILFLLILIDFWAGLTMDRTRGTFRKVILILSILSTCSALFLFKYFNFFNAAFRKIGLLFDLTYLPPALYLLLPIGLSFHTFQSLSYVIEVYRGNQQPERRIWIYALYVMFFPQLVAGPIERPQNLLHQFDEKHDFEYTRVTSGLQLMVWGFFKKVVIADRLALFVDEVYRSPMRHEGMALMVATVFFAYQIYCDFSGYSDIASGAAEVMGFRLRKNFSHPYAARSVSEFWTRWHISLSSWFRDYVYIPLGGNRVSLPRWCFNILLTFLLSGLWHGANKNFLIWGGLNGFYLIFGKLTLRFRQWLVHKIGLDRLPKLYSSLQVLTTFSLICVGWIFFRTNKPHYAFHILTHLFSGLDLFLVHLMSLPFVPAKAYEILEPVLLGQSVAAFMTALFLIVFLEAVQAIQKTGSCRVRLSDQPVWVRWSVYYGALASILVLGVLTKNQFIYYQF